MTAFDTRFRPSLNRLAAPLVEDLVAGAERLRILISRAECGVRLVDAGIGCPGSLDAGRRIAEICMGGLGSVRIGTGTAFRRWGFAVEVGSTAPVLACLAGQLAGWQLTEGEGKGAFFALGSGPARALARKEKLFEELGYADQAEEAALVLEVDRSPPEALLARIAQACGVAAERLTVILTPTTSLAGTVQIVGRALEVALHKAHELGFPLDRIRDGLATAPLPPPGGDFVTAMGRTNDAIIFGGAAHLYVTGPDADAKALANALPSRASRDYGKPFAEIFRACKGNFYEIDRSLFSPARAAVTAVESGHSFHAGALDEELLEISFA